jgi:hypothetical protein
VDNNYLDLGMNKSGFVHTLPSDRLTGYLRPSSGHYSSETEHLQPNDSVLPRAGQTIQRYLVQGSFTENPKKMSCTYQIHILSCVKALEDGRRRGLGTTWMKQNWSCNSDVIQVPWHGSHVQEVHNHYI